MLLSGSRVEGGLAIVFSMTSSGSNSALKREVELTGLEGLRRLCTPTDPKPEVFRELWVERRGLEVGEELRPGSTSTNLNSFDILNARLSA